jgi:hypothetical protein
LFVLYIIIIIIICSACFFSLSLILRNLHYLSAASSDKDIKRFVSKQRKESTAAMQSGAELARKVANASHKADFDELSEGVEKARVCFAGSGKRIVLFVFQFAHFCPLLFALFVVAVFLVFNDFRLFASHA